MQTSEYKPMLLSNYLVMQFIFYLVDLPNKANLYNILTNWEFMTNCTRHEVRKNRKVWWYTIVIIKKI